MNQDDPFGDYSEDDKTVLKPMPGGRRPAPGAAPPERTEVPPRTQVPARPDASRELPAQLAELQANPLVDSAFSLLTLAAQLRNTASHGDIPELRNSVMQEIKQFESRAKGKGIPTDQVHAARYCLCSLIDEIVLNTPWGCNSLWTTQSLLITFHKEAWGGEKFFHILKNVSQQPGTYLYLLELIYLCLSLGFEGKYRVQEHGIARLERVREDLYEVIRRQRGEPEPELSDHWQGIKDKRNALIRYVPLWVVGAIAGLLLMVIYLIFVYLINRGTDPLLRDLYAIGREKPKIAAVQPRPAPTVSHLSTLMGFLEPEVRARKVELVEAEGKTIIRLIGSHFFPSGSASINDVYYPLLRKIAEALSTISGPVLVAGHTDDVPIFTARFQSNWDLSRARADSVAEFLQQTASLDGRVTAEGRADTEPLVPNDTPAHRALNRRVEIII